MPILPPSLDDRRFDDLVDELLARIPAHTPEWTHPRLGDPGRTLIELFAWLGDTLLYRANLIPERQRLVFDCVVDGQLNKTIAWNTGISIKTVEYHRGFMMEKMGAKNVLDLIRMASTQSVGGD